MKGAKYISMRVFFCNDTMLVNLMSIRIAGMTYFTNSRSAMNSEPLESPAGWISIDRT